MNKDKTKTARIPNEEPGTSTEGVDVPQYAKGVSQGSEPMSPLHRDNFIVSEGAMLRLKRARLRVDFL